MSAGEAPFLNREASWLAFNARVLEEGLDPLRRPMDRLRFLAIFSSNLDEFFMIRLSGLWSQVRAGYAKEDASRNAPGRALAACEERVRALVPVQMQALREQVLPQLERSGVRFHDAARLPPELRPPLSRVFQEEFQPILTPMAVDPGRPFPFLAGRQVYLLVELRKEGDDKPRFAIVPIPSDRRFVAVPGRHREFVYAESLVQAFAHTLFSGFELRAAAAFRITRDGELSIMEDEAVDLLSVIEGELKKRDRGIPLRLEIEDHASPAFIAFLASHLEIEERFIYRLPAPLQVSDFMGFTFRPGYDELRAEPWPPVPERSLADTTRTIFDIVRERDRLLHLPFETFDPVVRLLDEASRDPDVLAIKQTLYRTSGQSPVVAALKRAAAAGKQVTVLVELKARFDEAQNIGWARSLEDAGCYVVYGLVGMKIHCKMLLVVRREAEGLRRYVHLSTGNYNDRTAQAYTDLGLFTASPAFGREVAEVFNLLTGYSEPPRMRKLVTSPLDLRQWFLDRIAREAERARRGEPAEIRAKMNSLVDEQVIRALYRASGDGVRIDLLVRGVCCLCPGVAGHSENIRVRSIIDRYLEHSRVFCFHAGGEREVYLASADWMDRNFDRRVEVLFPVEDADHRRVLLDAFEIWFADNTTARALGPAGAWERLRPAPGEPPRHAQRELHEYHVEKNASVATATGIKFIPVTRRGAAPGAHHG
ncbi:MAG: polyphosphate kinase 1 [Spirochaetes bacterium]|nr:polyphosphate kinase 1 [Spirochaetota bacterium]